MGKQNPSSSAINHADKNDDLGKTPISEIMNPSVITISETSNIKMAIQIMFNRKISGLHVTGVIPLSKMRLP